MMTEYEEIIHQYYLDHTEVDLFRIQRVGAGALQEGEVLLVLLYGLVDTPYGFHRLHPSGYHHGSP